VLKAAAPKWTFEQINFVARRRGAVVEDDFYNKFKRLNVLAGEKGKILAAHVQHICEAHDTVMRFYYQQIHQRLDWGRRNSVDREHWRTRVCVNNSQSFCHQLLRKGQDGAKLE